MGKASELSGTDRPSSIVLGWARVCTLLHMDLGSKDWAPLVEQWQASELENINRNENNYNNKMSDLEIKLTCFRQMENDLFPNRLIFRFFVVNGGDYMID